MNASRPRPRVYFYRDGRELTYHPSNGRPVLGFGMVSGKIGNAPCFESIIVRTTIDDEVTEADFDGPVSMKIWSPETEPVWLGLASVATVDAERQRVRAEVVG